jgi:hypothetical protein
MCCYYELLTGFKLFEIDKVNKYGGEESTPSEVTTDAESSEESRSFSSTSFDEISFDEESDTYQMLHVMQDYLGPVPKAFYRPKYHIIEDGVCILRDSMYAPTTISEHLVARGIDEKQSATLEKFLLSGLKYKPKKRINIDQVIATL